MNKYDLRVLLPTIQQLQQAIRGWTLLPLMFGMVVSLLPCIALILILWAITLAGEGIANTWDDLSRDEAHP